MVKLARGSVEATGRLGSVVIVLLLIVAGVAVRAPFLSTTCGSDVVQFAGFADTFLHRGFSFYEYNYWEAPGNNWPYPWRYIYGPVLLFTLAPLRLLVSDPVKVVRDTGLNIYVSPSWCAAVKSVFTAFDILVGLLIFLIAWKAMRVGRVRSTLASLLYLLNPMTIYISAIYGMFDNIALSLLLLGAYLYMYKGRELTGLFITGLSLSVKQTILPLVLVFLVDAFRRHGASRGFLNSILAVAAGALVPFTPFIVASPPSLALLVQAFAETSRPGFTEPLVYSFNGVSSLITFIHRESNLWVIESWWIPFTVLTVLTLLTYYRRGGDLLAAAFTSYAVFTASYWRVNHQYLVPLVAAISLILVSGKWRVLKPVSLFIYIWIGLWPVAFPTSWWSHVHLENPDVNTWRLLDSLSLMIFDPAFYVAYSLALTLGLYIMVTASLVYWRVDEAGSRT